jgi:hypothetical protein
MTIKYNTVTKQWTTNGRGKFTNGTKSLVDDSTPRMKVLGRVALGPVESGYDSLQAHDVQGTMRAHHVADSRIQQLICDFLNGYISIVSFLDHLGTLYQTSWIDVLDIKVSLRFYKIWQQWIFALTKATATLVTNNTVGWVKVGPVEKTANWLASELSNSLANLRVGHQITDGLLGNSVAPRLRRGLRIPTTIWDALYCFLPVYRNPTLSFETSLVINTWSDLFTRNGGAPGAVVTQGFFQSSQIVVPSPNSIVHILGGDVVSSENIGGTIASPVRLYPGTQDMQRYAQRVNRSFCHCVPTLIVLFVLLWHLGLLPMVFKFMSIPSKNDEL